MKKIIFFVLIQIIFSTGAFARDTVANFPVDEALSQEKAKSLLGSDIKFYFGDQKHGKVIKNFGEFKTNKKTNAFNKSDKEACEWAFLSAMLALKKRAVQKGGNAVINIKSNYKNNLTSSNDSFECGAGAIMSGVALVGTIVTIEE